MKYFFLIIVLVVLIIIMFLNTQIVEGLTAKSLSRHTTQQIGASRKMSSTSTGTGRVSTSAEYTHQAPVQSSNTWDSAKGQWNN